MIQKEIDRILLLVRSHGILHSKAAKEIYKLHLEDKINLLKTIDKDGDEWESNVKFFTVFFDTLKQLQQELKTLEGE